jgi:hypothetical protein
MAEALVDEIEDPATGLVTRDFLRSELARLETRLVGIESQLGMRIAELESRLGTRIAGLESQLGTRIAGLESQLGTGIAELETRLLWRLITVFGIQIALVGVLVAVLVQDLR